MTPERSRYGIVAELEHRPEHHGGVSAVIHMDGTVMATTDSALVAGFLNAIYDLHHPTEGGAS